MPRLFKNLFVSVCAVATATCGPAVEEAASSAGGETTLNWQDGPDSSRFAVEEAAIQGQQLNKVIVRCWPHGEKVVCVEGLEIFSDIGSMVTILTFVRSDVPTSVNQLDKSNGYRCGFTSDLTIFEEIWGSGGRLDSNFVGIMGSPTWSPAYVKKFIGDNGLEGFYFRCPAVARALRDGSLASLATTKVTKEMIEPQ